MRKHSNNEIAFEESLSDEWADDLGFTEVPLSDKPIFIFGILVIILGVFMLGRVFFLGVVKGEAYQKRAESNLNKTDRILAPRGIITDKNGDILADNKAVFSAKLNVKEFLKNDMSRTPTINFIQEIFNLDEGQINLLILDKNTNFDIYAEPVTLSENLTNEQYIAVKNQNDPSIVLEENYIRNYPEGSPFSTILGYVGLVTGKDLEKDPSLSGEDYVGKAGIELQFNSDLVGIPGGSIILRNAKGEVIGEGESTEPKIGKKLELAVDGDLQKYFYSRMLAGLRSLGRDSGVGLAMNPQNGEILAMVSFPSFDNNIFHLPGKTKERNEILNSSRKPLFNRAVSGTYAPGSTIKPLVGVATLTEKIVSSEFSVFSPGYLDVPNPYNPEKPTRFLDWRPQGYVNLYSAIAQSSNVYFYTVGGGAFGVEGLGISRLKDWWLRFGLGSLTGVNLPNEVRGFLPDPEWKEKNDRGSWLLGDTYNVSIGQGDLMVTPIQLLSYISGIANGGKLYRPTILASSIAVNKDLTEYYSAIKEVQSGMRRAVTSDLGTARTLNDLSFKVAGKTGSAQIQNNQAENAFFVGYGPYKEGDSSVPEIAILILVERAKEGSLNAVPIAKDVFNWYYENRLKN